MGYRLNTTQEYLVAVRKVSLVLGVSTCVPMWKYKVILLCSTPWSSLKAISGTELQRQAVRWMEQKGSQGRAVKSISKLFNGESEKAKGMEGF